MYFTDDSLLPENQDPLIITAAPYGPVWLPEDYPEDIAVTWEEQVQKAVDCYNAGAIILHIHVRDPKTGHISKNFKGVQRSDRPPAQSSPKDDPAGWRLDLVRTAGRRHQGSVAGLRHPPHADYDRP